MRRRLVTVLLSLACALGAAGCGDDDTTGTSTVGKQNPGASETSNDPGETVTDEEPGTETGTGEDDGS